MITKIGNEEKKQLVAVCIKAMKGIDPALTDAQIKKVFSHGYGMLSKKTKGESENDKL